MSESHWTHSPLAVPDLTPSLEIARGVKLRCTGLLMWSEYDGFVLNSHNINTAQTLHIPAKTSIVWYTLAGAVANQVPPKNRELATRYMQMRVLDSLLLSSNRDPATRRV